jgi:uncharacterized protein YjiS (DUF1127 family)
MNRRRSAAPAFRIETMTRLSSARAFRALSLWFEQRRTRAALGAMGARDLADLGLSAAPETQGLELIGYERARRQNR